MREAMARDPVDLVILDLVLPGEDGLQLARELRGQSEIGIVMLTGRGETVDRIIGLEMGADDYLSKPFHMRELLARVLREHWDVGIMFLTGRGETVDRIIGLEMGADDYLAKPFNLRELLARVRSVLRRVGQGGGDHAAEGPVKARFAGWRLDLAARELVSPAGEQVRLTTGEFDLLVAFVRNANRVLSRDRLMVLARHREAGPLDRTIDVQVGRLRRKLETDPDNPVLIKTVRGTGYIFTAPVEPA
jgi:two-component system OmpR family response regulator